MITRDSCSASSVSCVYIVTDTVLSNVLPIYSSVFFMFSSLTLRTSNNGSRDSSESGSEATMAGAAAPRR